MTSIGGTKELPSSVYSWDFADHVIVDDQVDDLQDFFGRHPVVITSQNRKEDLSFSLKSIQPDENFASSVEAIEKLKDNFDILQQVPSKKINVSKPFMTIRFPHFVGTCMQDELARGARRAKQVGFHETHFSVDAYQTSAESPIEFFSEKRPLYLISYPVEDVPWKEKLKLISSKGSSVSPQTMAALDYYLFGYQQIVNSASSLSLVLRRLLETIRYPQSFELAKEIYAQYLTIQKNQQKNIREYSNFVDTDFVNRSSELDSFIRLNRRNPTFSSDEISFFENLNVTNSFSVSILELEFDLYKEDFQKFMMSEILFAQNNY